LEGVESHPLLKWRPLKEETAREYNAKIGLRQNTRLSLPQAERLFLGF
jgi:hypothetical protein